MRAAKRFGWEAAHRLPRTQGPCRNLHGHSYRMFVEVEGPVGDGGMVVDFQEIKAWVSPIVAEWDHSTLVAADDADLLAVVRERGWKHAVLPFETTAENLARHVAESVAGRERARVLGIGRVRVRLHETETCYAEAEIAVGP